MDSKNYKEGQSMQRPPLFEANCFIYWKNRFETYVKSKDIDLWHIIVYGNYKPTIKNKDGNKQVKDNKIDLFVQKYEEFVISDDETIDCAFARFNTIITSLKALDKSFSSRNHVRKFLRAIPTKWRPKAMAIEESKDLSTLPLDEIIGNLKVYEVVLEKYSEISNGKKEKYKSLALKARKASSDEEVSCSDSDDEEYAMAVRDFKKFFKRRGKFFRQPHDDKKNFQKIKEDKKEKDDRRCFKCGDPNHFISDCPKHSFNDQKAFVVGCWSDSEEDSKKDEICLMALDNNEVLSNTPYYSSSSLDSESLQNEYNKLYKISLRIIDKNKHLKAKNELLKNEACAFKKRLDQLEMKKEASIECETCVELRSKVTSLSLKLASFKSSSYFLQEMIDNQRSLKDKHGLGFTEDIASTSKTKIEKLSLVDEETPIVELEMLVSSARELASSNERNRPSAKDFEILEYNIVKRNRSLQITKKPLSNTSVKNVKQTPNLKLGQGLGRSRICDKKCKVLFSETGSEILKDGITIGRGIRKNGLYIMKIGNSPKDNLYLTSMDDTSTLWHRRLGHANMRLIQSLSSKELVRNLPKLKFENHFCDACNIGKQVHASHKAKNMVSTTKCLELLHMDLFGPSAIQSYGGNFYTLVIVDDYSRYTWTRFLKHKNEAFDHFEILSKKIQVQKGCPIISIRTDHGREFDNEVQFGAFCDANGITHNFSAPRTPQSNGVVERKNQTLQEMSRTMLNEQSIP
ncbi:retrovirus-related pol polyprotein from transposon TNT 1-94 [Tanacetum coccineum]